MSATSILCSQSSYHFPESLREDWQPEAFVHSEPGEWEREELLIKMLGARGWGRVHHFRYYYAPGWGEGEGRALSPRALESFYQFLSEAPSFDELRPSVFLTDQGGLELVWGERGSSVQLEFTAHGIEFFREATGEEKQVPLNQSREIARLFKAD